jgi:hypothetical protein
MRDFKNRCGPLVRVLTALALLCAPAVSLAWDPNAKQDQERKAAEQAQRAAAARAAAGVVVKKVERPKPWSVWGIFETHWSVVRDNQAKNDFYHVLYLYGNYDLPKVRDYWPTGRISLRMDFTRRYVADPDESGILSGDLRLYYSYPFSFKVKGQEFLGRGYFYWTFPTSKLAQKEGNIARPTILFQLMKELPKGFTLLLRPMIRFNWDKYAEAEGGAPNRKWDLAYDISAIWTLPWHKPLNLSLTWYQGGFNSYDSREGETQPWNQEYAWEASVGYSFLQKPVNLEAYIAITSGRRAIEDGVWRFHFTDRDETEGYLSLRAIY